MPNDTPPSPFGGARMLHTMLRVERLDRALDFYTGPLGMRLLRREDYPGGRYTLAFVGYGREETDTVLELTHNWDRTTPYDRGTAFGHVAIGVGDLRQACDALAAVGVRIVRPPGPMADGGSDVIAFIEDPDGNRLELIERPPPADPSPR